MSTVKVATLGPRGTYSEEVALSLYGEDAEIQFADIPTIFDMVMEGEIDYGVVPIEDSVEGDVSGIVDEFRIHDVFVIKEFLLDVVHCLLGLGKEEDLEVIGSHPQALAHCRNFLRTNFPDVELRRINSTAEAARIASKEPNFGAIANERCASIYGLNVLRKNIHDYGMNETQFFSIANNPILPIGSAKTSFLIYPRGDHPGLLSSVLTEFAMQDINLAKIVSRPARGSLGGYMFYIDVNANQTDPRLASAVRRISRLDDIDLIRSFGSYTLATKKDKLHQEKKLKLPEKTIMVEGGKINVDASNLEIGVYYPISYSGGNYLVRRPKKGTLQLYEVETA